MTTSTTIPRSPATQLHSTTNSNPSSASPSPNAIIKDKQPHSSSRQQYPPPPPYPLPLYYPPYMLYPPYMYQHPPYLQPPQQPSQLQLSNQRDEDQDDVEIIMNDVEAPPTKFLDRSSSVTEVTTRSPPAGVHPGLRNQLEYYFSRQNLANDAYLVSQMDSDLYVPIATVASFNKVKAWTTDYDTIVLALKTIPAVTVDETNTKVKPNISTQRTTIILRDIDASATKEDIAAIFTSEAEQVSIKDIKQEVGNMWYVTFNNEEETINMLFLLRGKTFRGKAIAGRIKSKAVLRNVQAEKTTPVSSSTSPLNPPSSSYAVPSPNPMQMPFPPYPTYYGPQGYPMLPMMPMGWTPPQPQQPFFQKYNPQQQQQGNYQDGDYRNNNSNHSNRKRYNGHTTIKYPHQQQQQSQQQDQRLDKSSFSQPNFRNQNRKGNNRSQYSNNFNNNNRNQQAPRYNSIDQTANPATQTTSNHSSPSSYTSTSNQTGGEFSHSSKSSTQKSQQRRKKKHSDRKNPETSLQPAHFPPLPTSASASPDEGQPTQSQSSSSFSYADMLKVQQSR
ncbi:unnamed protein product [Umbelopsis vinacea]